MRHATDAEIAFLTDLGPMRMVHGYISRETDEREADPINLRLMTLRDAAKLAAHADKLHAKVLDLQAQLEAERVAKCLDVDAIVDAIRKQADEDGALHFDAVRQIITHATRSA